MAKTVSVVSEKYLLDALDRIARNPFGYSVLCVNVSKLKPKNRHPQFVKIFAKLFDSVVGTTKGTLYVLSNGDFVILGKNITHEVVEEAVNKLKYGLSSDPVVHSKDSGEFVSICDFPDGFADFYSYIEDLMKNAGQMVVAEESSYKRPVDAGEIENVIAELDNIDIAEMVKRQSVLKIKGAGKFEVLFQEFFVAVKDLAPQLGENLDLVANRWLFLYLTQTLDKKTISAFKTADLQKWPAKISINLNLSSVFSKEFVTFAKEFLRPGQQVIVEVQLMDAFNNLALYFEAKEILRRGGHKLLIDALSPSALKMLNISRLDPDMIKIFWEPLLEFDADNQELKTAIERVGRENVVLAKCDSDKALKWGVSYGITSFQGPYIDTLEAALIRSKCSDAQHCKPMECLKRRRRLSGLLRDECTQKDVLEELL